MTMLIQAGPKLAGTPSWKEFCWPILVGDHWEVTGNYPRQLNSRTFKSREEALSEIEKIDRLHRRG